MTNRESLEQKKLDLLILKLYKLGNLAEEIDYSVCSRCEHKEFCNGFCKLSDVEIVNRWLETEKEGLVSKWQEKD